MDAQIAQAEIAVSTAKLNLGYTKITSPINGTVVAIPVEEGQTVNAVQSAPTIIKVAQLDTMTVEAQISEADVVKVKAGMPVYFTILGEPEERFSATLRAIEPAPTRSTMKPPPHHPAQVAAPAPPRLLFTITVYLMSLIQTGLYVFQ